MATMPATLDLEKQTAHGGRGPTLPPARGGNGGGGGGGGGDDTADFPERLRRYRLGVILALVSIVMLFVGLTSAYLVRMGSTHTDPVTGLQVTDWQPMQLPLLPLGLNTLLILASSFTLEMARRALKRQLVIADAVGVEQAQVPPWLGISVVLGVGFLIGQVLVWQQLRAHGVYVSTNPSSSFFYILTALHAVHLAGGVLALLYAQATALLRRELATRLLVVDVTSLYWHFMAGLWLYIFALMQFVQ